MPEYSFWCRTQCPSSWAQVNREQLLPSREQLQRAERITNEYREKLGDKIRMFFVVPDYYETRPKRCMNGEGFVISADKMGWIGITPRGAFVTADLRISPLVPGWLMLVLAAGLAVAAWLVEGRFKRRSA